MRPAPFAPRAGFAQEGMEGILPVSNYDKGIKPRSHESPERRRPGVIESSTYTWQVSIDDGRNPDLAASDVLFYPFPLACKSLQSMDFSRWQVNLVHLFWVDERHFGQGKGIDTIALDRPSKIPPQGGHFLSLGFYQPAIRMAGS